MAARGKEISPMDAGDEERDGESITSWNEDKGKGPFLEPPPDSFTSAENAGEIVTFIRDSSAGVLWSSVWKDHAYILDKINRDKAALVDWLLLPSATTNTIIRQYSFLKLLTLHGLAPCFEPLKKYRADSGSSTTLDIPNGDYFLLREQNRKSFYNILEIDKTERSLPYAARSLPAGVLLYMLLQDIICLGMEVQVDELQLGKFMLYSGYTDEYGKMNMNAFCDWIFDFRIRDTSEAYIAGELCGEMNEGPTGEFFRSLEIGHDCGYTVAIIRDAFKALNFYIKTYEAMVLLQDPWKFYQLIQVNAARRYILYRPYPTTKTFEFDKWLPLHRLMIFVTCFMTLRVERRSWRDHATPERESRPESLAPSERSESLAPSERESSPESLAPSERESSPESPTTPERESSPESPTTPEREPSPEIVEEINELSD